MNIIEKNISSIKELCKKHKVKKLYAFGSVTNPKKFSRKSDVDLLVEFKKIPLLEYADNYFSFIENLEKLFHREVDLLTEKYLRNKYFIQNLNRTKKIVYSEN